MGKYICKSAGGIYLEVDTENLPDSLGTSWMDTYDLWGYDYNLDNKLLSVIDMGDYFECYYNDIRLNEIDSHMDSFLYKCYESKNGLYKSYDE